MESIESEDGMHKIISKLLIMCITMGLLACTNASQSKSADESQVIEKTDKNGPEDTNSKEKDSAKQELTPIESGKHVLVAYFSVTGNTKTVAEKIASVTDAAASEIVVRTFQKIQEAVIG